MGYDEHITPHPVVRIATQERYGGCRSTEEVDVLPVAIDGYFRTSPAPI
jgi:hypothetical protein